MPQGRNSEEVPLHYSFSIFLNIQKVLRYAAIITNAIDLDLYRQPNFLLFLRDLARWQITWGSTQGLGFTSVKNVVKYVDSWLSKLYLLFSSFLLYNYIFFLHISGIHSIQSSQDTQGKCAQHHSHDLWSLPNGPYNTWVLITSIIYVTQFYSSGIEKQTISHQSHEDSFGREETSLLLSMQEGKSVLFIYL